MYWPRWSILQDTLLETTSRCAHVIDLTGCYWLLSDVDPSLFQMQITLSAHSVLSETVYISSAPHRPSSPVLAADRAGRQIVVQASTTTRTGCKVCMPSFIVVRFSIFLL
jgi:hypothetical protein